MFSGGESEIINNDIFNYWNLSGPSNPCSIWFEGDDGGQLLIENNVISDSTYGIQIFSPNVGNIPASLTIQNNTIIGNTVGIYVSNSYMPTIVNNNILNNLNIELATDYSGHSRGFDASNNWWGTTDQQAINQSIYDFKNDSNLGVVTFVPFLTESNPEASSNFTAMEPLSEISLSATPTLSPSFTQSSTASPASSTSKTPTPSPTTIPTPTATPAVPEFSLLAVIPLLIGMLSVAVILGHRKTAKLCKGRYL